MAEDAPAAPPMQKNRRMPPQIRVLDERHDARGRQCLQAGHAVRWLSGPSHLFMALGGTPPSASHVPGASWDVLFMEPTRLPTSQVSPAPAEQPGEPAAPARARRAPHR
ncbi:hypothetical protein PIB30_009186 [Stylosanthes scabra]|uniref:Uncharacterized protein n=1 Tax=Stylosanthes scabra TaxID=79078 RepID=A0ABU6Y291_9FABA|nr:hypothetical protein [Stylosanthes scabra]